MRVKSFIQDEIGLTSVDIELTLTPGLPQMKFLGLPDALIKESEIRIRAALRSQGFELPKAQQILVQLRPASVKKHSQGLDLAVAAAYLWETEQLPKPIQSPIYLYGELDFEGNVRAPQDAEDISLLEVTETIITGSGIDCQADSHLEVKTLRDLCQPVAAVIPTQPSGYRRPEFVGEVASHAARVAEIIAVGEHSALFAGPPGTGKTTLAEMIHRILPDPKPQEWTMSRKIARRSGENLEWRPLRRPHHTATTLAITGGGGRPLPGEITRAHGGMLIFDELLEFHQRAIEALREPLESGRIVISRASGTAVYPARFVFLATTNFCPCGGFFPGKASKCVCTLHRRRNYVQRLSGPLLDRFAFISLSHQWGRDRSVGLESIYQRICKAREFAIRDRKQEGLNSQLNESDLREQVRPQARFLLSSPEMSQRRMKFRLQVARTIADLALAEQIGIEHLEEAEELTCRTFTRLHADILRDI